MCDKGIRRGAPPEEGDAWLRIVGVVDDIHKTALHDEPPELAYYPLSGASFVEDVPWPMGHVVRVPSAAALAGPVRQAVRGLDPALPGFGVETMETRVAALSLTGQLRAILFETSPLDPVVFVGVSVLPVSMWLPASWGAGAAATQVEPVAG